MVRQFLKFCLPQTIRPTLGIASLMILSGCSSLSGLVAVGTGTTPISPDPFVMADAAATSKASAASHLSATDRANSSTIRKTAAATQIAASEPGTPDAGTSIVADHGVPSAEANVINPSSAADAASGDSSATVNMAAFPLTPASGAAKVVPVNAAAPTALRTKFHAAIPRLPSLHDPQDADRTVLYAADTAAHAYPDEYIFDGGDRAHPVHYYGGEMEGLDTEDTVAEYKDHLGRNSIQPSNRVAIYAPRFGAVQSVSGLNRSVKVDKAVGAENYRGFEALHHDRGLETNIHNSTATGLAVRRRVSGFETSEAAHRSQKLDGIVQTEKVDQGLQAWNRTGLGTVQTSDVFELNLQIRFLVAATADTVPAQRAATQQATATYSTYKPAATVGVDRDATPGKIVLNKEASQLIAEPGDEITFTIRFRNAGQLPVNDVRIIDNLTPRLIYVNGSGELQVTGNAGGGLVVVPNQEGSQQLIFELDEPLRGGESGTIVFRAIVR